MHVNAQPQIEIVSSHRPLVGRVTLPGSKSITNRALLMAALAPGTSQLSGVLVSDDTVHMMTALRAMGVQITSLDATTLVVQSNGKLEAPAAPLFVGNAGTATRFLTAVATLAEGQVVIDGDEHMRKRPIRPLVDALRALGVDATTETSCPPVVINGRGGFTGQRVEVDANLSSQYVSALLMLAPCGQSPVDISLRGAGIGGRGYIDLTLAGMASFGADVQPTGSNAWRVEPTGYTATDYLVEPDASACTYLWAAEVLTGGRIELQVDGADMTQPDARARDIIRQFPNLPAVIEGSQIQDAIPTLAVLAAFNENPVRFTGIGNLRVKECDRIRALSTGLCQIRPGLAEEVGDDLIVQSDPQLTSSAAQTVIDSWADHRIAMSFALAGLRLNGIVIDNPACVSKTFPAYWDTLAELGVNFKVPETVG
jgi:3-phosphoshikimate 1-carboxyvinyltransferase